MTRKLSSATCANAGDAARSGKTTDDAVAAPLISAPHVILVMVSVNGSANEWKRYSGGCSVACRKKCEPAYRLIDHVIRFPQPHQTPDAFSGEPTVTQVHYFHHDVAVYARYVLSDTSSIPVPQTSTICNRPQLQPEVLEFSFFGSLRN